MSVARPTFHESWYRICDLRPRLRSTVQSQRQFFRGQPWYVFRDPGNNDHFRVGTTGHRLISLLDGTRTLDEVWTQCLEAMGDDAPTQGEVVQLLGQLYQNNLLRGDISPDVAGMFERMRKRKLREVGGYFTNILFLRIPLFDPDRILDRMVPLFGWVFSGVGLLIWLAVVLLGLRAISGQWDTLSNQADNVLDPGNLPWMYVCFIFIKAIHEFSHGIACKKFGQKEGAGEVHTIGVMLLVFTPMPYIDATSSWSLRSKSRRMMVAAAGMFVELAVAAIAAMIWANSLEGTTLRALSYNVMFIASVSTLLFNANPLLRYDGYYILSDWLEIPNLYQRAKNYLYYLIRRYVYGVRHTVCPAHTPGEKIWFFPYSLASLVFRILITTRILLFVADKLFIVGMALAVVSVFTWVIRPLWKFGVYLSTNGELARTRTRAVGTTLATLAGVALWIGALPVADTFICDGVIEPETISVISTGGGGKLTRILETDALVVAGETIVLQSEDPELVLQLAGLQSQRTETDLLERLARANKQYAQAHAQKVSRESLDQQIALVQRRLDNLTVRSPHAGRWLSPRGSMYFQSVLKQGQPIGAIVDTRQLFIRCVVSQADNARLIRARHQGQAVTTYRLWNRPELPIGQARIEKIIPAGQERLPSAALGYHAGGSTEVQSDDQSGTKAAEPFFDVHLQPTSQQELQPGQRVRVKFSLPEKPLLAQWTRRIMQLYRARFQR